MTRTVKTDCVADPIELTSFCFADGAIRHVNSAILLLPAQDVLALADHDVSGQRNRLSLHVVDAQIAGGILILTDHGHVAARFGPTEGSSIRHAKRCLLHKKILLPGGCSEAEVSDESPSYIVRH